jgi:hypothetical protein
VPNFIAEALAGIRRRWPDRARRRDVFAISATLCFLRVRHNPHTRRDRLRASTHHPTLEAEERLARPQDPRGLGGPAPGEGNVFQQSTRAKVREVLRGH